MLLLNSARMHAGGEAQAADDADAEAPAAKRRRGRKGKKVAARAAEPASSPGAYDTNLQPVPCGQKRVCMHACAHGRDKSVAAGTAEHSRLSLSRPRGCTWPRIGLPAHVSSSHAQRLYTHKLLLHKLGAEWLRAPGELVLEVVNRTPLGDAFAFARVENGLARAGAYRLEYEMAPAVPGCAPLSLAVQLAVAPGPAAGFEIQARLELWRTCIRVLCSSADARRCRWPSSWPCHQGPPQDLRFRRLQLWRTEKVGVGFECGCALLSLVVQLAVAQGPPAGLKIQARACGVTCLLYGSDGSVSVALMKLNAEAGYFMSVARACTAAESCLLHLAGGGASGGCRAGADAGGGAAAAAAGVQGADASCPIVQFDSVSF